MFLDWFFGHGRRRLMRAAVNPQWEYWIADNVWHWHVINQAQRRRLLGLVNVFIHEKNIEGCDGLQITDQIRVTIAAAACILLVAFDDLYCFDKAQTILVYPRPMVQRNLNRSGGTVDPGAFVSGLATQGGTIVLSWRDVLRDCRDEQSVNNVVVHEFAHHVDGIDGYMEGIPPLPTEELRQQWHQLAKRELENLRQAVAMQLPTVLDPYGCENLAEFFAVASEAFYCDGLNLFEHHPEIYQMLAILYRIESKSWFQQASSQWTTN